jgi:hypothetical protein
MPGVYGLQNRKRQGFDGLINYWLQNHVLLNPKSQNIFEPMSSLVMGALPTGTVSINATEDADFQAVARTVTRRAAAVAAVRANHSVHHIDNAAALATYPWFTANESLSVIFQSATAYSVGGAGPALVASVTSVVKINGGAVPLNRYVQVTAGDVVTVERIAATGGDDTMVFVVQCKTTTPAGTFVIDDVGVDTGVDSPGNSEMRAAIALVDKYLAWKGKRSIKTWLSNKVKTLNGVTAGDYNGTTDANHAAMQIRVQAYGSIGFGFWFSSIGVFAVSAATSDMSLPTKRRFYSDWLEEISQTLMAIRTDQDFISDALY